MTRRLLRIVTATVLAVGVTAPLATLAARADVDQDEATANNAPNYVQNAPLDNGDFGILVTGDDANLFGNSNKRDVIESNSPESDLFDNEQNCPSTNQANLQPILTPIVTAHVAPVTSATGGVNATNFTTAFTTQFTTSFQTNFQTNTQNANTNCRQGDSNVSR